MERDLVKRALLPRFGFREPENPALGIQVRTLAAKIFLAANFSELVHELHSRVKPINAHTLAGSGPRVRLYFVARKEAILLPLVDIAAQHISHPRLLLAYKMPTRFTRAMRHPPRAKKLWRTVIVIGSDITGGGSGVYCL
jgi:hypothetical protein